jgi:hypothetical protein
MYLIVLTWALLQLRKVAFAILHSTTLLLPLWYRTLDTLDLEKRKMPRDVATRWNSTYDMLNFAVNHRSAIDDITGDKSANLRKYELDDDEWIIALQLRDTLKVRVISVLTHFQIPTRLSPDMQRRYFVFFSFNA